MNINAGRGTKVIYRGATDEQVNWGSNDDPRGLLEKGATYTVYRTEIHSWHTKVFLVEFPDKKFNSAHFD